MNQREKAERFQALHKGPAAFVIANPWDGGSARILAGLGFQALATSSGAAAGVLGRRDGKVTRQEALAQIREIAAATDLPLSGDLEKGFGDAPAAAAETIRLAAEAGAVGRSVADPPRARAAGGGAGRSPPPPGGGGRGARGPAGGGGGGRGGGAAAGGARAPPRPGGQRGGQGTKSARPRRRGGLFSAGGGGPRPGFF